MATDQHDALSNGNGAAPDDLEVTDGAAVASQSRRSAMRFAAAAATGAAGAVLLGQREAQAATGDPITVNETTLGDDGNTTDTVVVTDGRFVVKDWDASSTVPSGVESNGKLFGLAAGTQIASGGYSPSGRGVYGATSTGIGVYAESVGTGDALQGASDAGFALNLFRSPRFRMSSNFTHTGAAPAYSPVAFEMVRDSDGAVWVSGNSDTGGTWRRLSSFIGIDPVRAWDSREGEPDGNIGGGVKGQMGNGTTRVLEITDLAAIPTDTIAIACVLTAVDPSGAGRVVTWPAGGSEPATATGNFRSGNPVTNFYPTIGLGQTGADKGEIVVKTVLASGGVDLILDILGFYV